MDLDVGEIVLCTVDRIVGTVVFVRIEGHGEGSIILSEIAPGRIRNLREYVIPKKKIVCKVLRISGDRIDLSLRRVTKKEKKELIEQFKQEKSYISVLKSILGKEVDKVIEEITKEDKIYDFLEEAKENPKKLEKIVGKTNTKKILDILKKQKQKKAIVKKQIHLTTTKSNGLELIKDVLGIIKEAEIKYISAGQYSIKTESNDLKSADNILKEILSKIEKETKQKGIEFSIDEK
ncbi:hypothetical protein CMI40_02335 [Candidatus Pacearchaeota archaeon]|jgi:translation initiation factor 2 alpha subunit (eIF-2alpha)|nr:hypothetical protein [Candidatus Pacearchaeota archaeon]|tara:strand:+ start:7765 stop:8469 length:705 start_codon:yes stop_codon:yes gene_type:complete